jgi:hypothetical protein
MKVNNKNVSNRGAPKKKAEERIGYSGLTEAQQKQLRDIANDRNISIAAVKREAIEWYLEAVELGRRTPINIPLAETKEDFRTS